MTIDSPFCFSQIIRKRDYELDRYHQMIIVTRSLSSNDHRHQIIIIKRSSFPNDHQHRFGKLNIPTFETRIESTTFQRHRRRSRSSLTISTPPFHRRLRRRPSIDATSTPSLDLDFVAGLDFNQDKAKGKRLLIRNAELRSHFIGRRLLPSGELVGGALDPPSVGTKLPLPPNRYQETKGEHFINSHPEA